MSENLCFPAKLVSGHILDLIDAGVDRIFFPMVFTKRAISVTPPTAITARSSPAMLT